MDFTRATGQNESYRCHVWRTPVGELKTGYICSCAAGVTVAGDWPLMNGDNLAAFMSEVTLAQKDSETMTSPHTETTQ